MVLEITTVNTIFRRFDDIEASIKIIRELKLDEIIFKKLVQCLYNKDNMNDIETESLNLVVSLNNLIELIKTYKELKEFF